MDLKDWIIVVSLLLQEFVRETSATTCSYISSTGVRRYTFCMQKCCDDEDRSYTDVCCAYNDGKQVYLGAGMATIIVLSVFAICFTYVCCKQRLQRNSGRNRPSSRPQQEALPTVSLQVEPMQPPAYETLPPPYYSVVPGTSDKKEELSSLQDGPPPAYVP